MDTTHGSTFVDEPARRVPVLHDVDVVVAGSGIAGSLAAIAAGRQGARAIVVDRFGQLGGNIGPGMWAGGSLHLALVRESDPDDEELLNRLGMGGYADEFHRRVIFERPNADAITDDVRRELEARHFNVNGYRMGSGGGLPGYPVDSQVCSHVLMTMMDEVGVQTILSAYVADPILDGGRIGGLFVETKSGRVAVRARVVIDATGEADVAFRAGATVKNVSNPNLGTWFAIGGVDFERYQQFKATHAPATADDLRWLREVLAVPESEADPAPHLHHLLSFLRRAWERDEFRYVRRLGKGTIHLALSDGHCIDGMLGGRTGTNGEIEFSDAAGVTLMEREHRDHIYRYARFMRKYVPGFENAYLLMVAPYLNARGGRYMAGIRPVTAEDLAAERRFDDVLYIYNDRRSQKNCEVPYRSFVCAEVDGLLAAGRASHVYGPNLRGRCWALQNGQATGIAAAMCARAGIAPRDLDVRLLQRELVRLGCPVGDAERLRELGLA